MARVCQNIYEKLVIFWFTNGDIRFDLFVFNIGRGCGFVNQNLNMSAKRDTKIFWSGLWVINPDSREQKPFAGRVRSD